MTIVTVLAAIVILAIAVAGCTGAKPTSDAGITTDSDADYKAACQQISIEDLARNPDQYAGQKVKYTGEVSYSLYELDMQPDQKYGEVFVGVGLQVHDGAPAGTDKKPNLYIDTRDASVAGLDKTNGSAWKGTVIVYGEVNGTSTYHPSTYTFIELPRVDARYIERI